MAENQDNPGRVAKATAGRATPVLPLIVVRGIKPASENWVSWCFRRLTAERSRHHRHLQISVGVRLPTCGDCHAVM